MNVPLTQSPRGQAIQQGANGTTLSADEAFRQGFSQMAYDYLKKINPDLFVNIITFKILQVDQPTGLGVGAFVLEHGQDIFYIPVVVSENEIKVADIFYAKSTDKFYPLTKSWLDKVSGSSLGQMGAAVKPPQTLQTDVDIRPLIIPPTTGRYSYAEDPEGRIPKDLVKVGQSLHRKDFKNSINFPDFLKTAAEPIREGVRRILKKHTKPGQEEQHPGTPNHWILTKQNRPQYR
jgi:hypothetical protein